MFLDIFQDLPNKTIHLQAEKRLAIRKISSNFTAQNREIQCIWSTYHPLRLSLNLPLFTTALLIFDL